VTRYQIIFRDSNDSLQIIDDLWAADETLDSLNAAMMDRIHPETVIVDIRQIGVLMAVE